MKAIYSDSKTDVCLGDSIEIKGLFRKRRGFVIYVPGISAKNPDMEFNGLSYVGVKFDDGSAIATIVDPKTRMLKKSVRFCDRGARPAAEIRPEARLDG